eukprot:5782555-Amphidinium_carterae.1
MPPQSHRQTQAHHALKALRKTQAHHALKALQKEQSNLPIAVVGSILSVTVDLPLCCLASEPSLVMRGVQLHHAMKSLRLSQTLFLGLCCRL